MKHLFTLLFAVISGLFSFATVHSVGNVGVTFTPDSLSILQGDTVIWAIAGSHNVVEVDSTVWLVNGTTSNGGFSLPFGGDTVIFNTPGNFFYVCTPHASLSMKGIVQVAAPPPPILTQMDLPVTFDDPTVNYSTIDFGGTMSSFVVDPTNAANMVVQTEKTAGAQVWAGTTLALPGPGGPNVDTGFLSPIPFVAGATTMTVRVWSTGPGLPVLLKVEDQTNNTITCEVTATTTATSAWETLTFDFSAGTPALNFANTYNMASLFYNFGTNGGGEIFYWDDVEFATPPPPTLTQMDLPVTFDDPTVNYSTIDFGGTMSSFIVDPTNAANMVVQTEKTAGAQVWAGTTLALPGPGGPNVDTGFLSPIPFVAGSTTMTVRVWSTGPGLPVLLKVEDQTNNTITCEVTATTTATSAWETLTFDFSAGTPALNFANTYNMASLFYNFGTNGGGEIFYWDDVEFATPPPPTLTQMDLPVTFDDPTVNYSTIDFGGTMSSFIVDPTNAANMVVQTEKTAGAQVWAGTTLALPGPGGPNVDTGFLSPIPFVAGSTTMTVRVWSTGPGLPVLLKVEDQTNNTITCEVTATTTATSAWETLTFDFSAGTPALNFANTYNMASLFYNFGTNGGGEIFYWDDVEFATPPPPTLTQMDLPVTFDDPTVNYSTIDFGGTMSSFIVDPTNAANMVVQTEKTAGAQVWAGTTLALPGPGGPNVDTGFLSPIPFVAGSTTMTVRVWSTGPGLPVLLKVEDQTNNTITCEVTATTTATSAWETLTFDFSAGTPALNFANTYNMASLFYNFGTNGGGEIFYWDDVEFATPPPPTLTQMDLPVTFDDPTVNYSTIDFGGTMSSFIVDPTNAANMVVQTEKTAGAQVWAGTTLALPGPGGPNVDTGFLSPIPFVAGSTTMTVRVWSTGPGLPVLLKVEDQTNNTITCEVTATTTATSAWETLTFDFSAGTPALNFANTYNMASLFYNFGTNGGGEIFYWDDVEFATPPPPVLTQMDLPVTFDDPTVNYSTIDFGGTMSSFVVDPTNAANMVVQTEKTAGAQVWAGTTLALPGPGGPNVDTGFLNPIPFVAGNTTMTVRVWSTGPGLPVLLKVEDQTNNTITCEVTATTTATSAWETLTFDFSAGTPALNFANTYNMASLFYNFGTNGGGEIFYWDDIEFVTPPPPVLTQMDLPVTFDDPTVNYSTIDFGGTMSSFIVDPTNAANMVVQTEKTAGAQTWAGTTLALPGPGGPNVDTGFLNPIPFVAGSTTMTVRVWSTGPGLPVRLKVEQQDNNTITCETEALTTVTGAWETLTFDFANEATGTAALNFANTYNMASLFYNFGTNGGGEIFYWDDVEFGAPTPPTGLTQMDLPVTFDDATVNYSTIDFGGTMSSFIVDPTNAANMVVQTEKTAGAQTWAGTTLALPGPGGPNVDTGFLNPIPFVAGATTMSVRVWSTGPGLPVRLKVEQQDNNTITCETEALTTVTGAWETLTFDFANEATGTAALNFANTYNMASLFYNFGTNGGGEIFYWDDVEFGAPTPPTGLTQMDLPVTFDDPTVNYSTIDFGGTMSSFIVDPTNAANMVVQTEKTAGAQVWAGTTLALPGPGGPNVDTGFLNPIPFVAGATTMSVRVWSTGPGLPVRLKVEQQDNNTITCETEALTTVTGAWETLTFDFANEATGTAALNFANTYNMASLFYNFGTNGGGEIFYWDDVQFGTPPAGGLTQMDLPVTFDDPTVNYSTLDFGSTVSAFIIDPTDPTNMVVQTEKTVGAATWAGTTLAVQGFPIGALNVDTGFLNPIPFSAGNTTMSVRVWSTGPGIPVRLKVEEDTNVTITCETEAVTTVTNAWETLTFDFANEAAGTATLNFASTYNETSLFYNFGANGNGEIFYWDDVQFGAPTPPTGLTQMDLPVTFDDPTVNYSTIDFGGTMSSFIADPTNAANMVVQTEKTAGAQVWAGTTLALPGPGGPNVDTGFLNPIPFVAGATTMSVRVWSTGPGLPVRLKVEQQDNNTITCETEALTTVTGAWETLTFDFANEATGTAALNFANTYNMASLFYNFGTNGGGEIFYWDDVQFGTPPVGGLGQMDLPVTFEDPTINYSTVDFGNAASMIITDPTDPTNTVVQTEKTAGSQVWAGTSLAVAGVGFPAGTLNVDTGFVNPIPFAAGATTMSVRIWSTGPGLPVRLKAEEDTNSTISVETEATTTVTNAWETLVFDFSNEVGGTPALNFANTYDKVSLFYNFGTAGNGEVFYWDDVEFGGAATGPCAGVSPDPSILDDFECNGNITYTFANATWTEDVANPNPTGINTSPMVGEFIHWGAGTDGAFGGDLDLGPLDLNTSNGELQMDVHPSASGLDIIVVLQDGNGTDVELQTLSTTGSGAWETLVFDFSASIAVTNINKIVMLVSPGDSTQHVVYFDNIRLDSATVTAPCAGVTPDPSILDDFECQGNITYTFANATWTEDVANPNPSGINTSSMVGEFIHWGAGTDGAFGGSLDLGPIDLATIGSDLKMDVHPSASGLDVIVVLQDSNGNDLALQTVATTGSGAWETLTFDMSAAVASNDVSNIVMLVSPGDSTQHVVYIDNIQFDTSTVVAPCAGVTPDPNTLDDFECQGNITYTFANATWTEDVVNPNPSGINTSSMVGEFIHWGAGTDGAFGGSLDLATLDLATLGTELKMDVHPSASGLPITIVLQDSNGNDLDLQTASTTIAGAWETLSYDMSAAAASNDVSSIVFVVSPGDSTQHVIYFDNIRLDTSSAIATCPGVTPDQDILEDFDCQRNTTYTSIDGNLTVIANPDPTGINTSDNVGEYTKGTTATDEIRGDLDLAPLDFASHNQMQLDVWDSGTPSEVTIVLEDVAGIFLASATATTSVGSAWEQLNFDFQDVPFTISVAKVVIQFNEGSQVDSNKVYYFDNLKMDGFVGIRDRNVSSLNAYPNPTNDFFTLSLNDLDVQEALTVSVVSMDGKIVFTQSIENVNDQFTLDLSGLDTGVYIVETSSSKQTWINRVMKK